MTKQYFNKREYLGIKEIQYRVRYGKKDILITMKWISGEYQIIAAEDTKYNPETCIGEFPYRKSVGTIDQIEYLLGNISADFYLEYDQNKVLVTMKLKKNKFEILVAKRIDSNENFNKFPYRITRKDKNQIEELLKE